MIGAVLALLAIGGGRIVLMDETLQVPARQWQAFNLELKQQPAAVDCSYSLLTRGAGVRLSLMHRSDMERFRAGVRHHVLAATEFQKSGSLRYMPQAAGEYSVVLDNRLEGRSAARVHLTVALRFAGSAPEPEELPVARKWTVIALAFLYVGAVGVFAVRRFGGVLLGRRPGRR